MKLFFKETTLLRVDRILHFLENDDVLAKKYHPVFFVRWHGNKQLLNKILINHDIEILYYKKDKVPLKLLWAYFLIGDRFCFILRDSRKLKKTCHAFFIVHSSISIYYIEKNSYNNFFMAISADFMEKSADNFLERNECVFLVYRIDTDAPTENGFTEELYYSDNIPKQWLYYF